jgi:hypothetical protein
VKPNLLLWLTGLALVLLAWAVAPRVLAPASARVAVASANEALDHTPSPALQTQFQTGNAGNPTGSVVSEEPADSAPDLEQIAEAMPLEEIPAVLRTFGSASSPAVREFELLLVRNWAGASPSAAAAWAAQLLPGEPSRQALLHVALGWAEADLPGVLQWAATLPESDTKAPVMLATAYEAARTEPIRAIDLGRTLPDNPEREALLVHAARQWADTDSSAAATWAAQVTDPSLRERLLAAILVAAAAYNPHDSATLLANELAGRPGQARAAVAIVQQWAQLDPAQAARWVAGFPEDDTGIAAVDNLVRLWSLRDRSAAEAWVRGLPESNLRQAANLALAEPLRSPPW